MPRQTPPATAEHTGQTRRSRDSTPLRRAADRARRRSQVWLITLASVVGLVVTAACATGTWFLFTDDATTPAAPAPHEDEPPPVDTEPQIDPIESRATDDAPLTIGELFDADTITVAGNEYQVLGTDELTECAEAATDELADSLGDLDCTQVVRATVTDADEDYVATVGAVNLSDADESTSLRELIEDGPDGSMAALRAGGVSDDLGLSPSVLGFNAFGHYMLYVVIGRTDGKTPSSDDEAVSTIVADLVDTHLIEQLAPRREG